ncbi:hypothetical protein HDEF_1126 [Candidatus Hamiltonella defensa 5AT (Acyrthosiphon pisum)]|uniref:Uncharacterized protein n=1 Tax=Hamiltonella defensa subsp. Acyrthosiphon pisum (strain 5AT) TaxID=572265 RepID=C4K5F4_HAMD5|nr:hypothetical protein HDEF_1126 [Candidatus Hamiltonella defensa 5AT (Acyrthosiphon pisum)]
MTKTNKTKIFSIKKLNINKLNYFFNSAIITKKD